MKNGLGFGAVGVNFIAKGKVALCYFFSKDVYGH
jgi:hypothetical protein